MTYTTASEIVANCEHRDWGWPSDDLFIDTYKDKNGTHYALIYDFSDVAEEWANGERLIEDLPFDDEHLTAIIFEEADN